MESFRESNGQFKKGHAYSKGNPFNKQVAALRDRLYEQVSAEDFADLVTSLLSLAKGGNIPAMKLLLEHLIGRPVQAVHLSGPEGEPLAGVSLGDVQLAVIEALADEPSAKIKVAQKLRELHDRLARNGGAA